MLRKSQNVSGLKGKKSWPNSIGNVENSINLNIMDACNKSRTKFMVDFNLKRDYASQISVNGMEGEFMEVRIV